MGERHRGLSLARAAFRTLLVSILAASTPACARKAPEVQAPAADVDVAPPVASSTGTANTSASASPEPHIADDRPLRAGRVGFEGMAVPTKGGLDVRGVTLSLEAIQDALTKQGVHGAQMDDLLGCRLAIVAELVDESERPADAGLRVQSRAGTWLRARELISARVVAKPREISGEVVRSKGYFAVGSFLVAPSDLNWALAGQDVVGKRVRLWGQPRTVRCEPDAQCLTSGSLPLFDVGRAELVP